MAPRLASREPAPRSEPNMPSARTLARQVPAPLAVLLLGAALLGGCAGTPKGPATAVQWPLPPDKPRVRFVRSLSTPGDLPAGLWTRIGRVFVPPSPEARVRQPTGLALSVDERRLFISSASESRVLEVDLAAGRMRPVANVEGRRPTNPFAVAVDADDNLYVGDFGTDAIWVYSPSGDLLRRLTHERLQRPTGIAIDRRAQLLYAVCGVRQKSQEHRVEVFSLTGQHLRTIGTRGAQPGQFNLPTHLAVGPEGNLYVVDMLNFRIQIFDREGRFLSTFGSIGAGFPGTFDKAKGIAFDSFGNLYVTDSQQGYVQIFNSRQQSLMAFGGRADLPGYMAVPTAIVIDSKNVIYVADFARSRVNVYELINTTAEDSFAAPEPAPATGPAPQPSPP